MACSIPYNLGFMVLILSTYLLDFCHSPVDFKANKAWVFFQVWINLIWIESQKFIFRKKSGEHVEVQLSSFWPEFQMKNKEKGEDGIFWLGNLIEKTVHSWSSIEKPDFWYLIFESKSGNCQIIYFRTKSACILNFGTAFTSN